MPKDKGTFYLDLLKKYLPLVIIGTCSYFTISIDRNDFTILVSLFALSFIAYFSINKFRFSLKQILFWAVILRVLVFIFIPNLSDDIYRFIWDGALTNGGVNAYSLLPGTNWVDAPAFMSRVVFDGLNSKEYYSVYPPIMQVIFAISVYFSGDDIQLNLMFFRIIILLADIGIIFLLGRMLTGLKKSNKWVALYAFNPLVIIELTGNIHFEGVMLFFTLLSFYILMYFNIYGKWFLVAVFFFAVGVMVKLTSLLLLPILLYRLSFRQLVKFTLLVFMFCGLMFLPFYSQELIANFFSGLDLYFRNFEFNASFFYLINALGESIAGWDTVAIVGPLLSMISMILILKFAIFKKKPEWSNFFTYALFGYFIYLSFSTTVHPWYIVNLLVLSVLTHYRFAVVWSLMVFLSYFMYGNGLVESSTLLIIEYLVVFVLFYIELRMPIRAGLICKYVPLFREDENL